MNYIKWLLFDFGGCLDSDGVHSRKLFFNEFERVGLIDDSNSKLFQEAYTYSDQLVIDHSLVLESRLLEMNNKMCDLIAQKLSMTNLDRVKLAAQAITDIQSSYLSRNKSILEELRPQFKLGVVSNFSGNLNVILEEFSLKSIFNFVLDSYHEGATKPDPALFISAISKCQVDPTDICFIGDNLIRDIAPAKMLGMKTIHVSNVLSPSCADFTLTSVTELLELAHKLNPATIQKISTNL